MGPVGPPAAPDIPVHPVGPVEPPDTTALVALPQIESGIFPFNLPAIRVADDEKGIAMSDQSCVELGDRCKLLAADASGTPIGDRQSGKGRAPDVLASLAHGARNGRETLADPSGARSLYEPYATREPGLALDLRKPGHWSDQYSVLQH